MPILVQNAADRRIFSDPPNVINVVAGAVAVDLLPDDTNSQGEISFRGVQNTGANPINICFNTTATLTEYHVQLTTGQQLNCSDDRQRISGYSDLGTTIATNIKRRGGLNSLGT